MKRHLLAGVLAILSGPIIYSSPLTPEDALARISGTRAVSEAHLIKSFETSDGQPTVYVFSKGESEGFMLLSADDIAPALLGYSDSGYFDPANVPPALKYWIQEYSAQIASGRLNPSSASNIGVELPKWASISPKISTKWDQDAPYNNLCPMDGDERSVAGCVAVSMAQAMKYFNYPAKGKGSVSFSCKLNGKDQTLSLDFSSQSFDWTNMLDSYSGNYTTSQATAVASLIKATGYSVKMQYSSNESGAYSSDIAEALVNYFDYDPSIRYYYRAWYNYSKWAEMIYNNLKETGPVIYNGSGEGGAHSFVVDGYQDNGYFHMNWGWGGISDGYFLLDALDPYSLGIGGGSGGFNYNQSIILNMKPNTGNSSATYQTTLFTYGSVTGSGSNNKLKVYSNDPDYPAVFMEGSQVASLTIGVKIEDMSDSSFPPVYLVSDFANVEFNPKTGSTGYYFSQDRPATVDLSEVTLNKNSQYKVTAMYRKGVGEWNELVTDNGFANYFYLKVPVSGNQYEITTIPVMMFDVSDFSLGSKLYFDLPIKVTASISNRNDIEITRSAVMVLFTTDGNAVFTGSGYTYTLAPGQTFTETWNITLTPIDGDYELTEPQDFLLGIFDMESGLVYYIDETPVTMLPYPGDPVFSGSLIVNDATSEYNESLKGTLYHAKDSDDFSVTSEITVEDGYFCNSAYLCIFTQDPTGKFWTSSLRIPYPLQQIEAGETSKITVNVNVPDLVPDEVYMLNTLVQVGDGTQWLENPETDRTYVIFSNNSDVRPVFGDGGIEILYDNFSGILTVEGGEAGINNVEVYSLSGMKLTPAVNYFGRGAELNLSSLGKGMVLVTVTDTAGHRKSAKLAL